MKWIFLAMLCMACPLITGLVKTRRNQPPVAFLFAFLPFVLGTWHLYAAPIALSYWPGHTKGLEISVIDCLAVAIIFGMRGLPGRTPLILPITCYIAVTLLTTVWSINKLATVCYVFQLVRMFLVYLAAQRLSANPKAVSAIILGGCAALALQAFYAIQQHHQGQLQASGTLGAQNLLGLMANITALPACALLLGGSRKLSNGISPILAIIIDILTASRATLGFAVFGAISLFGFSGIRQWTSRKAVLLGVTVAAAVIVSPIAAKRISQRTTNNSVESSNNERESFKTAAWLMIHDHPMGVGANDYVVIANLDGYLERAGVAAVQGSRATNVHNSYLLVIAETGYFGLLSVIGTFGTGLFIIIYTAFKHRKDSRGEISLGFGAALLMTGFHLNYEWAFVTNELQYIMFLFLGLGIGLSRQIKSDAAQAHRVRGSRKAVAQIDGRKIDDQAILISSSSIPRPRWATSRLLHADRGQSV